jgi:hypothetical protein
MASYIADIERAKNTYDAALETIALQYRREVLLPICVKHGLEYIAGMGAYLFFRGEEQITQQYNPTAVKRYGLIGAFHVLEQDVSISGDYVPFGWWVSDITTDDVEAARQTL